MRNKQYRQRFISMMVLPCAIWYYEIVFSLSTTHTIFRTRAWFYSLLFSLASGLFEHLFASLSRNKNINRYIKMIWLFATGFPFGVEYFVYKKFNQLYDLTTVLRGAGGAVRGFGSTILRMMFSPDGVLHLLLFLLPFIIYCWKGRKFDDTRRIGRKFRARMIAGMIGIFLVTVLLIALSGKYRPLYWSQYSFTNSVQSFGFAPSVRKEIQHAVFKKGGKKKSFTIDTGEETEQVSVRAGSEAEVTPEPTPRPEDGEFNEMDLDFAALAQEDGGAFAEIDEYVGSLTPSRTNEYTGMFRGKNLIFFSAEAFSGYMIDENLTPTLYRMATKGIQFTDFYQPSVAGTTGGEVANLLGVLAMDGGASMMDVTEHNNYFTMGSQLDRLGYWGKMYHNNDYTFYERNITHNTLGYSNGFMGEGNGMEKYLPDKLDLGDGKERSAPFPQSDEAMVEGTFTNEYGDKAPFNVYYMTVSGHCDYTIDVNDMTHKHWEEVQDLPYSDEVKGYIAANLELEDALTWLVNTLEEKNMADDTVVVVCADHYPYGLANLTEDTAPFFLEELYGHTADTQMKLDENRLIIWSGCLEDKEPIVVDEPTFSLDILPTLSNLFGVFWDSRLLPGRDVFSDAEPLVFNAWYDWKTELGTYTFDTGTFEPAAGAEIPPGYTDRMNEIVAEKIWYCTELLQQDYFGHVLRAPGPQETVGPKDEPAEGGESAAAAG